MGTGIAIASVTNDRDGMHVTAQITGTPSGAVSFRAGYEKWSERSAPVPSLPLGGGRYKVVLPLPDLWHLFAEDADGVSLPFGCRMGLADLPDADLLGKALQGILEANRLLIEVDLQTNFHPHATIKQIVYGTSLTVRDFPAILVTKPSFEEDYAFFPDGKEENNRFEIFLFLHHPDPTSHLRPGWRATDAIKTVINRYHKIVLESGREFVKCQARDGDADEVEIEQGVWVVIGSLVWTGNGLRQTPLIEAVGMDTWSEIESLTERTPV